MVLIYIKTRKIKLDSWFFRNNSVVFFFLLFLVHFCRWLSLISLCLTDIISFISDLHGRNDEKTT